MFQINLLKFGTDLRKKSVATMFASCHQVSLYHFETPRAMSLFSLRIPPLRFQITSIGLGEGILFRLGRADLPGCEVGHGNPKKSCRAFLAHRPVEEAEEPGGVPGVAPRVDHLGPQHLMSALYSVRLRGVWSIWVGSLPENQTNAGRPGM